MGIGAGNMQAHCMCRHNTCAEYRNIYTRRKSNAVKITARRFKIFTFLM